MKRMIGAGLAVLLLAGCTDGGGESPEPVLTPAPPVVVTLEEQAETATPTPSVVMVRGLDGEMKPRASAETIAPDEAIMATMECEPITQETKSFVPQEQRYRVAPVDPVQVLIGEGLDGDQWWVVAFERDHQFEIDGHWATNQAWITTQPGVSGQGKWLNISGAYELPDGSIGSAWHDIHWDHDRLALGQSALRVALDCLHD